MPSATVFRTATISAMLGVALLGAAADAARADTTSFAFTGAEQTFRVPAGVTSLRVTAIGGRGGAGLRSVTTGGGFGARVTADLQVSPLQLLYVLVGANGANAASGVGALGVFNGGGGGGNSGTAQFGSGGGAGGGGTDVRLVSSAAGSASLTSRVVVAGGGGGSGGSPAGVNGTADGGDAGQTGDTGANAGGGAPGTGATASAPGGGGSAGASGLGGLGRSSAAEVNGGGGGGGGGGWFGGGGALNGSGGGAGGGGGGGGSSFVSPTASGASTNSDSTGTPQVLITYTLPAGTPPPSGGTPNPGGGTTTPGGGATSQKLQTYIDSRPRQTVRTKRSSTLVKFEFSSNVDGAKFRCKLDDRDTETCKSGKRYRVGKGKHKFSVRAVKGSRSDTTPATFSFRVADKQ
jgi:hypothetical protein